jgi:hypothetical protein
MIDRQQLEAAVRSGELGRPQLEELLSIADGVEQGRRAQDPEKFGFLKGFNDIFLALGVVLVLGAIGAAMAGATAGWVTFAIAAASWGMADIISRQTRAVLPLIAAAFGVLTPAVYFAFYIHADSGFSPARHLLLGSIAALLLASAYYLYFRLPFALGLIAGLGTLTLVAAAKLLAGAPIPTLSGIIQFVCGLCTFAAAMHFDMKDPRRLTTDADKGFWLHIAAAPMIVNAIAQPLLRSGNVSTGASAAVLALVVLLALVAMIVDRRALLVSSLAYFIIALIYLLKGTASSQMTGPADTRTFAIAFGLAGLLVLVLGIFWHQLRAVLFRHLPEGMPLTNLPPPGP